MIDYDKLKEAHELALVSENYWFSANFGIDTKADYGLYDNENTIIGCFDCEDELLEKLRELIKAKISCKYKIDQEVWHLNEDLEPESFKVTDIDEESEEKYLLDDARGWWLEEHLYVTKQELVGAQIKYWMGLRDSKEEYCEVSGVRIDKKCEHEFDGNYYRFMEDGGSFEMHKCRKCGRFYKINNS